MPDRDPTEGSISGEIPAGEAEDARLNRDPKTQRVKPISEALRTDAREARKRSQGGKHRAQ